jgi:hypothetical protein
MDKLGHLVTRMVTYWTQNLPQTSLSLLKENRLGDYLAQTAMSDLSLVYGMGENDMQRKCLWSDMMSSGQLNVFPTQTESADAETRKKVQFLLKMQQPWLVEEALERANLSRDWTPEFPMEYERAEM